MLSVPYILMRSTVKSDFQMMSVISPSLALVVRKHGAPKYRTEIVDKQFYDLENACT